MLKLFDFFADRYDLHTPPDHYHDDHELVLNLAAEAGEGARLLDIGCGTGVLVWKAQLAGTKAVGFDASSRMIEVAQARVQPGSVWVQRMQSVEGPSQFDLAVSLSWCVHYCADQVELEHTLSGVWRALAPGGRILLQVAHGPNLSSEWAEDREAGPTGIPDDISLRFRFRRDPYLMHVILADYSFRCESLEEAFSETHQLSVTNAELVAQSLKVSGFSEVEIWNSWRRDPFGDGGSVFVTGVRPI